MKCSMVDCPVHSTYLGRGFPGTPLDVTKPIQGPYGTGQSGPAFGKCPVTSSTAFEQDDDMEFARNLNLKKLNAFALGHGWYFWNFKTELGSRWNFLELVRQGAFPKNVSSYHEENDEVFSACDREDHGEFLCAAKRGVHPDDLERGIAFACDGDHVDCFKIDLKVLTLEECADWAFNEYWHVHRHSGATCDFGGAAHLLSTNKGAATPRLGQHEQQQRLHVATAHSSPEMIVVWCAVAAGIVAVVAAGKSILARHKRRQEHPPLIHVEV
jgi:glucan 1,3-beta-glucosidase